MTIQNKYFNNHIIGKKITTNDERLENIDIIFEKTPTMSKMFIVLLNLLIMVKINLFTYILHMRDVLLIKWNQNHQYIRVTFGI